MLRVSKAIMLLIIFLYSVSAFSQNAITKVREFWQKNEIRIIEEYKEFVAIPNVSRDTPNILRNAAFIRDMMRKRGIQAELLDAISPNVSPAVYGMVKVPGAKRTIALYAHYDGQPVNPAQWAN
ncbi:MAG TPA: hypothetical protein VJ765_17905, partial [Chitinophagaceae bacterium]|nr:hypothetical protein [Chitinophagaceae bacterium]